VDDRVTAGTERLVYAVVRIAGALIALKSGKLVFSKRSCVTAYREKIGDEWATFVMEVFERCHEQWRNQIPTDEAERRRLRSLYARVLDFENYFLTTYHALLIKDVNSPDERLRSAAVERLELTFQ